MTHTKDEALKLALEALSTAHLVVEDDMLADEIHQAITAIKQARALDKMAENARELGLDYEPAYKVTVVDDQHPNGVPLEQWGRPAPVQPLAWLYPEGLEALKAGKCWTAYGTKQDDNCNIPVHLAAVAPKVEPVKTECDGFDSHPAAPVQEPVAWMQDSIELYVQDRPSANYTIPLYTTPPAAPALQAELDATNRQVEILSDALAESRREVAAPVQEPVAFFHPNQGFYWARPTKITAPATVDVEPLPLYTTPPAAQRKPLTYEQITDISKKVAEGGPENSIDRFVRAIEAAHGIKGNT